MQRIALLVLTLLMPISLLSQTLAPDSQLVQIMENKDYSYYMGTWKWEDTVSQSEFVIKLIMAERTTGINKNKRYYLKGAYMYKKNGEIVADYMDELNENKEYVQYPIYVLNDRINNMRLRVRDYLLKDGYGDKKRFGGSSFIKYISESPEQILWRIFDDKYSGAILQTGRWWILPGYPCRKKWF